MIRSWLFVLLLVCSCKQIANAQAYYCEDGQITFVSEAPLSTFEGTSQYLKGLVDFKKNLLDFYIDLNTLKTGIKLRDAHMREDYLETADFPFAEFSGSIIEIDKVRQLNEGESLPVIAKGTFKLHGIAIEREIKGSISKNKDGSISLNTEFEILLNDHEIEKPGILGYDLADEQLVLINAKLYEKD